MRRLPGVLAGLVIATLAALGGLCFTQQSAAQQISTFPENRQPSPKVVAAAQPSPIEDPVAEQELLELANQQRREEGLPLLRRDAGLSEAARTHARRMVERQQLSHQFDGEPSLMPRLLEVGLQLDRAGENVAYNASAEKAFAALMQSPPHRRNLLDPNFNTAGFAAFWSDGRLYVVQDFAHQLPQFTPASAK